MADASDQRIGVKGKTAHQISRTDFHPTQGRGIRGKQTRKIWWLLSLATYEPNQIWRGHSLDRRPIGADPMR
jgi:hypothetical protein